jgi:large subunit ribosomal protein L18
MAKPSKKAQNRERIKRRVRSKISGTPERPRLSVFRSNVHIYAQLIDDAQGHTVASASSVEADLKGDDQSPTDLGRAVGQRLAERAKEAGIDTAVFDRNGFRYHGRVRAVAEGARERGLQF